MIPWKDAGFRTLGWWRTLQPDPEANRPGDRAALARLRRCGTVSEAMLETASLLLFQAVEATVANDLPAVALAAAVLAHVRDDRPGPSVARLIGPGSIETPETALLKPLRFRRLMEADGPDERLAAFRRLAALARGSLPVRDLAEALLDWSDRRRTRWVFEYWNTIPPAAAAPATTPSKDAP
jgi:CRISPR system Cascade subunit CasB